MSDATSSPALKLILDRDGSLIHRFNVRTTHPSQGGYLDFAFVRENEGRCRLTCSFPEQVDRNFLDLAKAMLSVDRAFDRFRRKISPTTDSIANDALARQESRLIRLEEIALKVTKSTQAHRDELDVLYTKKCQDLDEQTRRLRTELNEEFESKKTQLSLRKDAIAQKEKELERITNTDARRRLQQTIKSVVEKSHNNFSLTQKTSEKRNPVRNTFWALIAASGALTGIAVWQAFAQPTDVSSIVRATLSLMATIGTVLYFIRWQDRWAQTHADEEFRLKRFDLDIDRASWLVEVLLEWRTASGSDLPKDFIDKLAAGLFEGGKPTNLAGHPAEEAIAALLASSTAVKVNLPGGTVDFDHKAMDRVRKES